MIVDLPSEGEVAEAKIVMEEVPAAAAGAGGGGGGGGGGATNGEGYLR